MKRKELFELIRQIIRRMEFEVSEGDINGCVILVKDSRNASVEVF